MVILCLNYSRTALNSSRELHLYWDSKVKVEWRSYHGVVGYQKRMITKIKVKLLFGQWIQWSRWWWLGNYVYKIWWQKRSPHSIRICNISESRRNKARSGSILGGCKRNYFGNALFRQISSQIHCPLACFSRKRAEKIIKEKRVENNFWPCLVRLKKWERKSKQQRDRGPGENLCPNACRRRVEN